MDALYGDLRSNTSPHVEPHLIPTAVLGARVPKEIRVAPKMSRDPPPRTLPPSVQHDMHPDPTDKPYDPAHPNNYQEIITERLFKQKAAALQKKQQEEGERHKRERERRGLTGVSLRSACNASAGARTSEGRAITDHRSGCRSTSQAARRPCAQKTANRSSTG